MQHDSNEAFSRILIDKALEFSGWNLLDSHQVRFELNTENGRADYLLGGPRGPLCVLEAKREDVDPYDAKEQAKGYAENVKAPFIILSNGREHWFWNYTRKDQDAYRIERLAPRHPARPNGTPLHSAQVAAPFRQPGFVTPYTRHAASVCDAPVCHSSS